MESPSIHVLPLVPALASRTRNRCLIPFQFTDSMPQVRRVREILENETGRVLLHSPAPLVWRLPAHAVLLLGLMWTHTLACVNDREAVDLCRGPSCGECDGRVLVRADDRSPGTNAPSPASEPAAGSCCSGRDRVSVAHGFGLNPVCAIVKVRCSPRRAPASRRFAGICLAVDDQSDGFMVLQPGTVAGLPYPAQRIKTCARCG